MTQAPLLSVCIPVFDGAGTVRRCIESVLTQAVESLEVLVIDNCSTDETADRVREAIAGDSRGRLLVNDRNLGRIGNWNRCLQEAKGRFVKLLMVNDVLFRDSLLLQLSASQDANDVVMVTSQHQLWDGDTDAAPRASSDCPRRVFRGLQAIEALSDGFDPFWALNGMIFKREVAVSEGLRFSPDIAYITDKLFSAEISTRGTTIHLQTPTYLFNAGAVGRFHFKGLEPRKFLDENQDLFEVIGRILRAGGRPAVPMARRLADAFIYWYDNTARPPTLPQCWQALRGRPRVQAIVLWRLARRSEAASFARRWLLKASR